MNQLIQTHLDLITVALSLFEYNQQSWQSLKLELMSHTSGPQIGTQNRPKDS